MRSAGFALPLPSAMTRPRAEPPFPYLRWLGSHHRRGGFGRAAPPSFSGPRRARAPWRGRSGSGERTSISLAGDRMREREPRGVQELALEAVDAPGPPYCGSPQHRVADRRHVDADLVGAPGLERRLAAASPAAAARSSSKWVRASRGVVGVDREQHAVAAVAADRRVDRARARVGMPVHQRQVLASQPPRRPAAPSARGGRASLLATTSSPEVSRSRRCTIPARHGSSPPAARPASACASVPRPVAARRMHDHARRACRRPAGARPRRRSRTGLRAGRRPRPRPRCARPRPARQRRRAWRFGRTRPSTQHAAARRSAPGPGRVSRAAAPGTDQAACRRRRSGTSSSKRRRSRCRHHERRARPSSTSSERDHAERDRHVGDVERRPVRQLDEVGDRAVGDPVDQVADRAADQQPGRQPQPRPVGRSEKYTTSAASATSVNTSTSAPPPGEEAERDPVVASWTRWSRGRNLLCSRRRDAGRDRVLGHLVEPISDGGHRRRRVRSGGTRTLWRALVTISAVTCSALRSH